MRYNIKKLREKRFPGRGGQTLAAKAFGVSQSAWSRFEKSNSLYNNTLRRLAKFFKVNVEDLINPDYIKAESPPNDPKSTSTENHSVFPLAIPTSGSKTDIHVPITGDTAAATNGQDTFFVDEVNDILTIPKGTCTIRIHGNSMAPIVHDGQQVFLSPVDCEPVKNSLVVVWTTGGGTFQSWFKRWVGWRNRDDGGKNLILVSVNHGEGIEAEIIIAAEDFGGVRVVSGVWYG